MNKKLKKLIEDEENTMAKINELQAHLKEIKTARKQEEDSEIIRSVRARKLGARDLLTLLEGIQEGRIVIEPVPEEDSEDDEMNKESKDHKTTGAKDAPESEDSVE